MHVSIHWAIETAWCTRPKQVAVILPRDANESVCVMNDSTNREIKRQIHIFVAHYFVGGVEHAMDSHAFHQLLFCLCTESQLHNINYNRNEQKRNDRMDVCVCHVLRSIHPSFAHGRTFIMRQTLGNLFQPFVCRRRSTTPTSFDNFSIVFSLALNDNLL